MHIAQFAFRAWWCACQFGFIGLSFNNDVSVGCPSLLVAAVIAVLCSLLLQST